MFWNLLQDFHLCTNRYIACNCVQNNSVDFFSYFLVRGCMDAETAKSFRSQWKWTVIQIRNTLCLHVGRLPMILNMKTTDDSAFLLTQIFGPSLEPAWQWPKLMPTNHNQVENKCNERGKNRF